MAGYIPLLLQVKWLAFEDVVDWDSIAIIVHRSEMASIPERINTTDVAAKRADVGCASGLPCPSCRRPAISEGLSVLSWRHAERL
jgi:hypothetical protein